MYYIAIASHTCDNTGLNDTIVRFFETEVEAEAGLRAWFKETVGSKVIHDFGPDDSEYDETQDPYAATDVAVEVEDENGDVVKETRKTSLYLRALERLKDAYDIDDDRYEFDEDGLPVLGDMQEFANEACEALNKYEITLPTLVELYKTKRARIDE